MSRATPSRLPLARKTVCVLLLGLAALACGANEPGPLDAGPAITPDSDAASDASHATDAAPVVDAMASDIAVDAASQDANADITTDTTGNDITGNDTTAPPGCVPGLPCDDGAPCTFGDVCQGGECVGTPYTCDDGRKCTDNRCNGQGGCEYPVQNGWCLLNNRCLGHGALNPANGCERCDTDLNKTAWSTLDNDAGCEDGNPCTFGDFCKKGQCKKGLLATCDDSNPCTKDTCDPLSGCKNEPASGPCDDGDPCTQGSVCTGGTCFAPATAGCDDNNPCTQDTCLPALGCESIPLDGPCQDGDACTAGDSCQDGLCVPGPAALCDDENACTLDLCDPTFGCYHTLSDDICCTGAVHVCDDHNPCTTDHCQAGGSGCTYSVNTEPCTDGDACTAGDVCWEGACQPGAISPCDDGNPCTADTCSAAAGCQHAATFDACDDGIDCTFADTCVGGQCVGDASQCVCDPPFAATVAKATVMTLGTDGHPGNGLNIDEADSCAPAGNCSDGIDNVLAGLAGFINQNLEKEITKGGLILLFELVDPKTNGEPFTIRLYAGKKADPSCDHQGPGCSYLVDANTLDESCEPLIAIDNATIVGTHLSAGGKAYNFPLFIPLFGDSYLEVKLFFGRIEATIDLSNNQVTLTDGLVAGAIPKSTFITALELVPKEQLPVPKETIVQLLDILIQDDIDTGPPVGPDAASIGLKLQAVPAAIVGVAN